MFPFLRIVSPLIVRFVLIIIMIMTVAILIMMVLVIQHIPTSNIPTRWESVNLKEGI